jgi:hypothetical protein
MNSWTRRFVPVLLLFVINCGGTALDSPEFLPRTTFANGSKQITFIMASCSDTCLSYEDAVCSIELDQESGAINVEVSVAYQERDDADRTSLDGCGVTCGPPVYAHCDLPALPSGSYRLVAGSFESTIVIQ